MMKCKIKNLMLEEKKISKMMKCKIKNYSFTPENYDDNNNLLIYHAQHPKSHKYIAIDYDEITNNLYLSSLIYLDFELPTTDTYVVCVPEDEEFQYNDELYKYIYQYKRKDGKIFSVFVLENYNPNSI